MLVTSTRLDDPCICLHAYLSIYIHEYNIFVLTDIHTYVHVCVYVCIFIHIHTYIYIYIERERQREREREACTIPSKPERFPSLLVQVRAAEVAGGPSRHCAVLNR